MAKRIHNIHDIFVRESFSDAERAVAFFDDSRYTRPALADQSDKT
jgi:hypothetical protein